MPISEITGSKTILNFKDSVKFFFQMIWQFIRPPAVNLWLLPILFLIIWEIKIIDMFNLHFCIIGMELLFSVY